MELSKTQIDRLGDRLRDSQPSEEDLRLLSEYRLSFREAFAVVQTRLREKSLSPTGRLAKSTNSIVDKLRRQRIRLSRMQDLAGCRVVAENLFHQDQIVTDLPEDFPGAMIIDRRVKPSHGYRAVHIIITVGEKRVEAQLRTILQHGWAEVSEKAADTIDPSIKYGGGSAVWRAFLSKSSEEIRQFEDDESVLIRQEATINDMTRNFLEMQHALENFDPGHADLTSRAKELAAAYAKLRYDLEATQRSLQMRREKFRERRNQIRTILNERSSSLSKRLEGES